MAKPPIEGGEDKYFKGSDNYAEYLEGREAYMEGLEANESPYKHQPHTASKHKAWIDGWHDEEIWALDSTGR